MSLGIVIVSVLAATAALAGLRAQAQTRRRAVRIRSTSGDRRPRREA